MPDYNNSLIFKIVPKTFDNNNYDVFYGSTTQSLSVAFSGNKRHYNSFKQGNHKNQTVFILFDKYGSDNLEIILIDTMN